MNVKEVYVNNEFKKISAADYHKEEIYKFMLKHPRRKDGLRQMTIKTELEKKGLKLSRPTIDKHLDSLIKEDRVYRKGTLFFIKDVEQNSVDIYSRFILEHGSQLFDTYYLDMEKSLLEYLYKNSPVGSFIKTTSNTIISKERCVCNFQNNTERKLFEFTNRIGSFITYALIESTRTRDHKKINDEKRTAMAKTVINAISIEKIYLYFVCLLEDIGILDQNKSDGITLDKPIELDSNRFNDIVEIFKKIYPTVYEGLENLWKDSLIYQTVRETHLLKKQKCDHKWEETFIYKFPYLDLRLCRKCYSIVPSHMISRLIR